jgi:hypothetical protein
MSGGCRVASQPTTRRTLSMYCLLEPRANVLFSTAQRDCTGHRCAPRREDIRFIAGANARPGMRKEEGMLRDENKVRVFISYCHADRDPWLSRLLVHLKPLTTAFGIEVFSDRSIDLGEEWFVKIQDALTCSQVAILLISADFLASDFINREELPTILKNAQERGLLILPIIVSSCSFMAHQTLLKFQVVNPDAPLKEVTEGEQESTFRKVAERVAAIAGAYEISRVRERVDEQKELISNQQNIINQLVIFSMSFHIYDFLRDFANNKYHEFLYRSSEHKDIIRFLRDNGFIAMVHLRQLQEGENIVGKIVPTPIGRFYLEQRDKFERAGAV